MNYKAICRKTLYDVKLSIKSKLLMIFLLQVSEQTKNKDLEVSIKFLCEVLNYSNKTVVKAIQELESNGYINKTRRGQKGNIYNIVVLKLKVGRSGNPEEFRRALTIIDDGVRFACAVIESFSFFTRVMGLTKDNGYFSR